MINLLGFLTLVKPNRAIGEYVSIDFSDLLLRTLEEGSKKKELINTQNLRGIGKTYELIEFAKVNDYVVILANRNLALDRKTKQEYDNIYSNDINSISGIQNKNIVIDEGVTNIQELKDAGFNIVTGYYTEGVDSIKEKTFDQLVIETLKMEAIVLYEKIKQTREREDYITYKNLILAYKEVLCMFERWIRV